MESSTHPETDTPAIGDDIVFECSHCAASFVVEAAAAGVTLACQNCGAQTTVPHPGLEKVAQEVARVSQLRRQLKENESQRTEITGYVNQLNIQLHRWRLRLQTLNDRQAKLETELAAAQREGSESSA